MLVIFDYKTLFRNLKKKYPLRKGWRLSHDGNTDKHTH